MKIASTHLERLGKYCEAVHCEICGKPAPYTAYYDIKDYRGVWPYCKDCLDLIEASCSDCDVRNTCLYLRGMPGCTLWFSIQVTERDNWMKPPDVSPREIMLEEKHMVEEIVEHERHYIGEKENRYVPDDDHELQLAVANVILRIGAEMRVKAQEAILARKQKEKK